VIAHVLIKIGKKTTQTKQTATTDISHNRKYKRQRHNKHNMAIEITSDEGQDRNNERGNNKRFAEATDEQSEVSTIQKKKRTEKILEEGVTAIDNLLNVIENMEANKRPRGTVAKTGYTDEHTTGKEQDDPAVQFYSQPVPVKDLPGITISSLKRLANDKATEPFENFEATNEVAIVEFDRELGVNSQQNDRLNNSHEQRTLETVTNETQTYTTKPVKYLSHQTRPKGLMFKVKWEAIPGTDIELETIETLETAIKHKDTMRAYLTELKEQKPRSFKHLISKRPEVIETMKRRETTSRINNEPITHCESITN